MIEKKDFLEWAQFAGNYYGTPLSTVNEKIEKGFIVLLEIEVEGAKQIKEKFPEALSIFLLPPSKEELEKRIEILKEYIKIRPEKHIAIVSHSSYIGQMIFKKIEDEKNELKHCHPYIYKL